MNIPFRFFIFFLFMGVCLSACSTDKPSNSSTSPLTLEADSSPTACPVTEPAWVKPPADSAVLDPPAYSYYYVNEDSSIWASAYWPEEDEYPLRAGKEGNKMGWFRPAGATMEITGQRLDGQAPPLEADFPCCYPTRFQASGLYFPTEGCWEVTAKAADRVLSFIVKVEQMNK